MTTEENVSEKGLLTSYEPVELYVIKPEVTTEQVSFQMRVFAREMMRDLIESGKTKAEAQDIVKIDVEVTQDGEPVEGRCFKDKVYVIGDGSMPLPFDRNVLGMKVGESKEFEFKAPNPNSSLKMEDETFQAKVVLLAIMEHEPVDTPIDDAWVQRCLQSYKSAEEAYARIQEGMEEELLEQRRSDIEQAAIEELATRYTGKVSNGVAHEAREGIIAGHQRSAKKAGMSWVQYLKDVLGQTQAEFDQVTQKQALESGRQSLALDEYAKHFNIEPNEMDIHDFADQLAPGRGRQIVTQIVASGDLQQHAKLRRDARRYLAYKDLVDKADITYMDRDEADKVFVPQSAAEQF